MLLGRAVGFVVEGDSVSHAILERRVERWKNDGGGEWDPRQLPPADEGDGLDAVVEIGVTVFALVVASVVIGGLATDADGSEMAAKITRIVRLVLWISLGWIIWKAVRRASTMIAGRRNDSIPR